MKLLCCLFFTILAIPGFAQQVNDSIVIPVYDTTSVNISLRSRNYFPFCSKIYKIPKVSNRQDQSLCCFYETNIIKGETTSMGGQLSCNDGTSLFWIYHDKHEYAKESWKRMAIQQKEQSISYTQVLIKCFLVDQEVEAYLLSFELRSGQKVKEIIAYGTINGQSMVVTFMTLKKLSCNDDIPETFRPFIKLEF